MIKNFDDHAGDQRRGEQKPQAIEANHPGGARAIGTVPRIDAGQTQLPGPTTQLFGKHAHLANSRAFAAFRAPLRRKKWFVYTKEPFGGPKGNDLPPPPPAKKASQDQTRKSSTGLNVKSFTYSKRA
jgi:hypothetical protein